MFSISADFFVVDISYSPDKDIQHLVKYTKFRCKKKPHSYLIECFFLSFDIFFAEYHVIDLQLQTILIIGCCFFLWSHFNIFETIILVVNLIKKRDQSVLDSKNYTWSTSQLIKLMSSCYSRQSFHIRSVVLSAHKKQIFLFCTQVHNEK